MRASNNSTRACYLPLLRCALVISVPAVYVHKVASLFGTLHLRSRRAIKFLGSAFAGLLAVYVYFLKAQLHGELLHCVNSRSTTPNKLN